MFDFRHPFFNPLWRRVATSGFCAAWGIFELLTGGGVWGYLFLALAAGSGWVFFFNWTDID